MKTQSRYGVAFSLSILFLVAYFDRSNVTLLIADTNFTDALGITGDHAKQGLLMTFFLFPYAIGNFFMGSISEKVGGRRILFICYIVWGVLMCLMGMIPLLAVMLILRAILGIAESPITPVTNGFVSRWFPPSERTRANTVWNIGLLLAPAIAIPVIGIIIANAGWQASFFIIGIIGTIVPFIITYFYLYDSPDKHPRITKEEKEYITGESEESIQTNTTASGAKFDFLRKSEFWMVCVVYLFGSGIILGLTTWFPSYLRQTFNMTIQTSGFYSALPYIAPIILMLIFSPIVDRTVTKSWALVVGGVITLISMVLSLLLGTSIALAVLLAMAVGGSFMGSPVCYNIIQRITPPEHIATASGFLNGAGYLFAAAAPLFFGFLIDLTGSYTAGFMTMVAMSIIIIICALVLFLKEKRTLNKKEEVEAEQMAY